MFVFLFLFLFVVVFFVCVCVWFKSYQKKRIIACLGAFTHVAAVRHESELAVHASCHLGRASLARNALQPRHASDPEYGNQEYNITEFQSLLNSIPSYIYFKIKKHVSSHSKKQNKQKFLVLPNEAESQQAEGEAHELFHVDAETACSYFRWLILAPGAVAPPIGFSTQPSRLVSCCHNK